MQLSKALKDVPKDAHVYLWGNEFVSGGCVDNIALLSSKDHAINITLPSDTEVMYTPYSEWLYEKVRKETDEFERSISTYHEQSSDPNRFLLVVSDLVCEWALRIEICSLFHERAASAEYNDEWEEKAKELVDSDEVLQCLVDYIMDNNDHIVDEKIIDSALDKAMSDGCFRN